MTEDRNAAAGELARLISARALEHGGAHLLEDARSARALSFRGLAGTTRRYHAMLGQVCLPPGARVLVDIGDPLMFSAAFLAVISAGLCAVPVDPQAPVPELLRIADAVRPRLMIGERPERAGAAGVPMILAQPASDAELTAGGGPAGDVRSLGYAQPASDAELTAGGRHSAARTGAAGTGADGPAEASEMPGSVLLLTSGSTGAPKAVELSEGRLLHVARAVASHNKLTPDDRGFNPLPLFHINAEVVALLATLEAGAAVVLDQRFRRHGFWELLAGRDVTWINAVPAIWTILADYPVPDRPRRLRFIRSASAPLPAPVRERIAGLTAVPVVESYGMTEAASQITATPLDGVVPAGSCGQPVGVELQVRDPAGGPLPPGQVGSVWIRGAGVIASYVGGRAPERFDGAGWLDTRDLGHLDEEGFLFLAGRSDDVINRGGEMLYPREIEEVLISGPGVRDAVVVGRPDPVLGEAPVAYVLPAGDTASPMTAGGMQDLIDRLTARCAAQLSRFKRPEAIHVVEDLPRAATGKIQRHRLRQRVPAVTGTTPQ